MSTPSRPRSLSETRLPPDSYSLPSARTLSGRFGASTTRFLHQSSKDAFEPPYNSHVRRKPVPTQTTHKEPFVRYSFAPLDHAPPSRNADATRPEIYWVTPSVAVGLFLLGLGAALGHHFYLRSLNDTDVHNQVWTSRYSLALAFVVKASLAASVAVAYSQKLWYTLYRVPNGVSVDALDALFTVLEQPLQFRVFDLWRTAPIAATMALVIWLLPLSALVSPTALTVGDLIRNTTITNCSVPTLNLSNQNISAQTTALTLSTADYTGNVFSASMVAQRLVGLTLRNGRQTDWSSPCGANCTYDIEFIAPAWKCHRTMEIDSPEAPWSHPETTAWGFSDNKEEVPTSSYWFRGYGDGSNVTAGDYTTYLEYSPVYAGGLNVNTSQFWVGSSAAVGLHDLDRTHQTVQQYLNLHVYYCDFVNSTYNVRVKYNNGHQSNAILNVTPLNRIHPPGTAWDPTQGACEGGPAFGGSLCSERATLDAVSLYRTIVETIDGSIDRSPEGEVLVDNTTIALVPTLVQNYNILHQYGVTELAYPHKDLGPLLEELSHNVSISIISEPNLGVVGTTRTTCATSHTFTVWKYKPLPLALSYACAVGATVLALCVGGHALVASGVSRDKSFSSIVRTTRSRDLDELSSLPEMGALPLADRLGRIRLRFGELDSNALEKVGKAIGRRIGFYACEKVESDW